LLLCAAAEATEPPKPAPAATAAKPAVTKRLNLRIGDVRKYMTPKDYLAAINAPDADTNTVVVEGARDPGSRLQSELPVPGGLGSLWYAAKHPLQGWRIFTPDVNAPAMGPTWDKVPPPIFRWGP
jgi:hypothetical protein